MAKRSPVGIPDILETRIMLWNTETWEWEASTKGSGVGAAVTVENFPAVISGSSIPVNGDVAIIEENKGLVIYESGDILYVCKASIGSVRDAAVWQIKKVDGMNITYADGDDNYDNLATDLNTVADLDYL